MTCLKIYNLRDESAGNKVCPGTATNCLIACINLYILQSFREIQWSLLHPTTLKFKDTKHDIL